MWMWLIISMALVIACIVFGIYSFLSSRTLQKSISSEPGIKGNIMQRQKYKNRISALQKQAIFDLENRLKSIEANTSLSTHHLQELIKRVTLLESGNNLSTESKETNWEDSGEDWEKLYYETRREKRSLEDSLNTVKVYLEESINKLKDFENQQVDWAAAKSTAESGINEINSLQNIIKELKLKVEGGKGRETELAQEVGNEKSKYFNYEVMQDENNRLQSEIDILKTRLDEINEQNILMENKIKGLAELGSILEISEYEKMGIKTSVEQLLQRI